MKRSPNQIILPVLIFLIFTTVSFFILQNQKTFTAMAVVKIGFVNGEKIESLQSLFWRLHNYGSIDYQTELSPHISNDVITQPIDETTGVIKFPSNSEKSAIENLRLIANAVVADHNRIYENLIKNINHKSLEANYSQAGKNKLNSANQQSVIFSARKTEVISPPSIQKSSSKTLYYKSFIAGIIGLILYEIWFRFARKK